MRYEVTRDVAKHQFNNDYDCLIIHFDFTDKNFFWDKRNWLPKDEEVFKIFKILYNISPTFKEKINEYFKEQNEVKK